MGKKHKKTFQKTDKEYKKRGRQEEESAKTIGAREQGTKLKSLTKRSKVYRVNH